MRAVDISCSVLRQLLARSHESRKHDKSKSAAAVMDRSEQKSFILCNNKHIRLQPWLLCHSPLPPLCRPKPWHRPVVVLCLCGACLRKRSFNARKRPPLPKVTPATHPAYNAVFFRALIGQHPTIPTSNRVCQMLCGHQGSSLFPLFAIFVIFSQSTACDLLERHYRHSAKHQLHCTRCPPVPQFPG